MALEIGGGAVALLALGGAAFAIARRRRREDEAEWYDEQPYYDEANAAPAAAAEQEPAEASPTPRHDPHADEQPTIVAPKASAFAWGAANEPGTSDDGSDRKPGETWVERAYRGPSPANPSVSLRNRLRRAAFFDQRERDVAQGRGEPVDTGAGLPSGWDGQSSERELA